MSVIKDAWGGGFARGSPTSDNWGSGMSPPEKCLETYICKSAHMIYVDAFSKLREPGVARRRKKWRRLEIEGGEGRGRNVDRQRPNILFYIPSAILCDKLKRNYRFHLKALFTNNR